jgi:hypothetical protein
MSSGVDMHSALMGDLDRLGQCVQTTLFREYAKVIAIPIGDGSSGYIVSQQL